VLGNAEDYLRIPRERQLSFKNPRLSGALFGYVRCSNNLPSSEWIENRQPRFSNRADAISYSERTYKSNRERVVHVEVNELIDIHMTEVKAHGRVNDETSGDYFPIGRDVSQTVDSKRVIKPVDCHNAYDPAEQVHLADLCHFWIYLGPGLWIEFQVYQQMLPIVPDLHAVLLATLEESRRK